MALRESPLLGLIAASLVASSAVAFGVADVTVLDTSIAEYVMFLLPLSMVVGYAFSDVQAGMMENWELFALVAPTAMFFIVKYIPEVNNILLEYQPMSGIVLVGLSVLGFYVVVE